MEARSILRNRAIPGRMWAVILALVAAIVFGGWGGYLVKTLSLPAARTVAISAEQPASGSSPTLQPSSESQQAVANDQSHRGGIQLP